MNDCRRDAFVESRMLGNEHVRFGGRRRGNRQPRGCNGASPPTLHLPLERQAANLLFALVSRRYERGSIVVTSNRSFEQSGEILGDAMVAAALIDRLVHHATIVTLKGKSYRLKDRGEGPKPSDQAAGLRPSA